MYRPSPVPRGLHSFLITCDPHTGRGVRSAPGIVRVGKPGRYLSLCLHSHTDIKGSSCPSGLSSSGLGPELEPRTATLFPNFCIWVFRHLFGLGQVRGEAAGLTYTQVSVSAAGSLTTDLSYPASPDSRG